MATYATSDLKLLRMTVFASKVKWIYIGIK